MLLCVRGNAMFFISRQVEEGRGGGVHWGKFSGGEEVHIGHLNPIDDQFVSTLCIENSILNRAL